MAPRYNRPRFRGARPSWPRPAPAARRPSFHVREKRCPELFLKVPDTYFRTSTPEAYGYDVVRDDVRAGCEPAGGTPRLAVGGVSRPGPGAGVRRHVHR